MKTIVCYDAVYSLILNYVSGLSYIMDNPCSSELVVPSHRKPSLFVYLPGPSSGEQPPESSACSSVVKTLSAIQGILSVDVLPGSKERLLSCGYDRSAIVEEHIIIALRALSDQKTFCVSSGQKESIKVTLISVEGMTCMSCVNLIETTMATYSGVLKIKVSLLNKEAFVLFDSLVAKASDISTSIYDMGFDSKVVLDTSLAANACSGVPVSSSEIALINVEGMVCRSCVLNIENNISLLNGVRNIQVSLVDKTATVAFDPSVTSFQKLVKAIEDLGFEASQIKTGREGFDAPNVIDRQQTGAGKRRIDCIGIDGMTCHSCVNLIEKSVGQLPGVASVHVSLACKEGEVEYDEVVISSDQIKNAIDDMGFIVTYVTGK